MPLRGRAATKRVGKGPSGGSPWRLATPATVACAALFLALSTTGCGASSERGATLYAEGRYIEAAEAFERTEPRLHSASPDACAHYGLYRGLTFLKLDDLRGARQWLSYASSVERKTPGQLSEEERRSLARAWSELERRARDHSEAPDPAREPVAASDPQGMPRGTGPAANGRRSVRAE